MLILPKWAADRGLTKVSGVPKARSCAALDLSGAYAEAEDVVRLAAAAGARLLYVDEELFCTDDLDPLEGDDDVPAEVRGAVEQLLRRAAGFANRVSQLSVTFSADGVLHEWRAVAAWYSELLDALDALMPDDEVGYVSAQEIAAQKKAMVDALLAMPAYRAAPSEPKRRAVAMASDLGLEDLERPLMWDVLSTASQRVILAAGRAYDELEADLASVVAGLADYSPYQQASGQTAKRAHLRDFVQRRVGGYAPPSRTVALVEDAVKQATRSASGVGLFAPA
ncbi:hypothetical protein GCM10023205_04110 [Yinghuangia aomiensis]|uniref:Uncharacterized protein n=1 Tax=Yinghuangia aomiensis TaxID=676205 RepID=A0ABP9GLY3_9ACTN